MVLVETVIIFNVLSADFLRLNPTVKITLNVDCALQGTRMIQNSVFFQ